MLANVSAVKLASRSGRSDKVTRRSLFSMLYLPPTLNHDQERCRFVPEAAMFQKEGCPHRNGTAQGDAAPQCRSGQITNALTVDFVSAKKRAAKEDKDSPRRWFVYNRSPGW